MGAGKEGGKVRQGQRETVSYERDLKQKLDLFQVDTGSICVIQICVESLNFYTETFDYIKEIVVILKLFM